MSYPQPPMAPHQPSVVPRPPQNGLGTAGFVLGLLGLLFSFIPIIGLVAWPLVILGLVLGGLGVAKASRGLASNKGLALAGVVLSAIGLVVCIVWVAAFGKAANDAADGLEQLKQESEKQVTLVYEVSGDAPDATVTYSTFGDGGSATNQEELKALPWTKEVSTKGLFSGGTLTVTAGADGGTVICKITVDGVEKKTATGTGAFSTASCSDF